jgi:pyruvate formate lyase activating enzyme
LFTIDPNESAWKRVAGAESMSLCDWPDKISAVIYLFGCNLRCPTCHNWDIIDLHKGGPVPLPQSKVEVYDYISPDWVDGITITGGEPTMSSGSSLGDMIWELKEVTGLPVKLDTNGTNPEVIKYLLFNNIVDMIAMDIKGPFDMYDDLTGHCRWFQKDELVTKIKATLELAKTYQDKMYFRTTKVPKLHNFIFDEIISLVPQGCKHYFQNYRETDKCPGIPIWK